MFADNQNERARFQPVDFHLASFLGVPLADDLDETGIQEALKMVASILDRRIDLRGEFRFRCRSVRQFYENLACGFAPEYRENVLGALGVEAYDLRFNIGSIDGRFLRE